MGAAGSREADPDSRTLSVASAHLRPAAVAQDWPYHAGVKGDGPSRSSQRAQVPAHFVVRSGADERQRALGEREDNANAEPGARRLVRGGSVTLVDLDPDTVLAFRMDRQALTRPAACAELVD